MRKKLNLRAVMPVVMCGDVSRHERSQSQG